MRKLSQIGLVAAVFLAAAVGYAAGQAGYALLTSLAGTELVVVDAGGTLINAVPVNMIRNATGYQLLSSASGTVSPTNAVDNLLVNAQPAASTTFKTPAAPYDGELFAVCNVTSSAWATNTATLSATTGSSLAAGVNTTLTTLAARTCEEITYVAASTTWYQVR